MKNIYLHIAILSLKDILGIVWHLSYTIGFISELPLSFLCDKYEASVSS